MIITANDRLLVRLDGDIGAWERRIIWVPYERPKFANPISDFDGVLLREEGPGILNWMIQGAVKFLQHGGFPKESLSSIRVEKFVQESNSVCNFLTTCVERVDSGHGITIDELGNQYTKWCQANDWIPLVGSEGRSKLKHGMETLFHVTEVHDVMRLNMNNKQTALRGYHGVAFKADMT